MNQEFIFCPRCGAVTAPGVCTNCGFKIEKEETVNETVNNEYTDSANETSSVVQTETVNEMPQDNTVEKKKPVGLIIGIVAGVLAVLFLILILGVVGVVAFAPMIIKTAYTPSTPPSPVVNATLPNTTDDDDDDDEEEDNNKDTDKDADTDADDDDDKDTDTDDTDDDIVDEFAGYSETIEPLYGGTSQFDYDKFVEDFINNANEYWDEPADDTNDFYLNGSYSSYMQSPYSQEFIERDGFETPYYQYVVNSYVENDNYEVERRIIRFEGQINGIFANAYCAYYNLYSDDVDYTAVNEALRNQAVTSLYNYVTTHTSSSAFNYTLYCDSVITFNNDDIFSVAYNSTAYADNNTQTFYIHGVNVDVKNGEVMDNTKIFNLDDDFSRFFISRSNTQNSFVEAINYSDIKDVTKVLNDDDSLIVLFTPLGLEIGCDYRYKYTYGWVTVTINDFDKYLSGNYKFDSDFGKGYDIFKYEKENGITPDGYDADEDDDYYDL